MVLYAAGYIALLIYAAYQVGYWRRAKEEEARLKGDAAEVAE